MLPNISTITTSQVTDVPHNDVELPGLRGNERTSLKLQSYISRHKEFDMLRYIYSTSSTLCARNFTEADILHDQQSAHPNTRATVKQISKKKRYLAWAGHCLMGIP